MNETYVKPTTIGNTPIVGNTAREQATHIHSICKTELEQLRNGEHPLRIYAPELTNKVRDLVIELFLKDNLSVRYFRNRQYKRTPYFIFVPADTV